MNNRQQINLELANFHIIQFVVNLLNNKAYNKYT